MPTLICLLRLLIVWSRNGQFEMTTDSDSNAYVKNGKLYLTPTLTADVIGQDNVLNGHTFNLTGCTNIISGKSSLALARHKDFSSPLLQMAKVDRLSTLTHAVRFPTVQPGKLSHPSCRPA